MAIATRQLVRKFVYNGMDLPDPNPAHTPLQVRDFWANANYGELTSAAVEGPTVKDGVATYTFLKAVRDKGGA